MKGLKKLQKLFKIRSKTKSSKKGSKSKDGDEKHEENNSKNPMSSILPSQIVNNMSFPSFSNKRKNEEHGKETDKTAKKPKVIIYECIFKECSKRFHQNISSFKMHFVNLHVKKEIEKCIIHYQDEQQLPDRRQCPFEPCGYFAPFW